MYMAKISTTERAHAHENKNYSFKET